MIKNITGGPGIVINGGNSVSPCINQNTNNPMNMTFRQWVHELWLQNCDEHMAYHARPHTQQAYWNQYKYWLKREYRYQKSKS